MTGKDGCRAKGFKVQPKSIADIRAIAVRIRGLLKPDEYVGRMEAFLDSLMKYGINYDVLDDKALNELALGPIEAAYMPVNDTIYFSEETYTGLVANNPRAKFTLFHELGHCLLNHNLALHRGGNVNIKPYEDSEWQADQFAAEMSMPVDVIQKEGLTTPTLIVARFGMSNAASERRLRQLRSRGTIR